MNNLEINILAIKAWLRLRGSKNIFSVLSIIIVFSAVCSPVTAQEKVYEGDRVILAQNISGAGSNFYVYIPPLQIKGLYKDTTDAKNQYREELMISILSSKSQQWENYNTLGGKADKKNHPLCKCQKDGQCQKFSGARCVACALLPPLV